MSRIILQKENKYATLWLEEETTEMILLRLKEYVDFLVEEKRNGNTKAKIVLCGYYKTLIYETFISLSFSKEEVAPEIWKKAMEIKEVLNKAKPLQKTLKSLYLNARATFDEIEGRTHSNEEIIKKTYLTRSVFYKIQSGDTSVEKDNLLKFTFAMKCELDFTEKFLESAGKKFISNNNRDKILKDCFVNRILWIPDVNEKLKKEGEKILKLAYNVNK